jgi:Protein of unknown function (DUF4238)
MSPSFLLKNFCIPGSDRLYCFNKKTGKSFQTNVKDIAHENLFYGIPEAKDDLEQGIARVEGKFLSRPYSELLKQKSYYRLSHDEKAWFCVFLGFQLMRSNVTRQGIKEMREKVVMAITRHEFAREQGTQIPEWLTMRITDPESVKVMHLDVMVRDNVEPFLNSEGIFLTRRGRS